MAERKHTDNDNQLLTKPATKTRPKLGAPRMYKVLFHNDDFTPREFVVGLLIHLFRMSEVKATQTMMHIHNHGVGVVGVYTYEIAETKVAQVMSRAQEANLPLLCTMEPEDAPAETGD
ncbi:MAG: ATP-dependent Clp protease adaptor ClpS [Myxococcales bacterium]|nr:ATP-dependent Clp protease adaptor ClpS [Myxococcales bacterium]